MTLPFQVARAMVVRLLSVNTFPRPGECLRHRRHVGERQRLGPAPEPPCGERLHRDARRVRFYREIAAARAGLDPSFIGIVFDGMLIAGLLVGSNQTASPSFHGAWCLEMAYDQSQAELGPGQLLLLLAVGEAIRRGDRHLNFMQNFSYYKHRWKAEAIDAVSVQLIRRASLQNLRAWLGELKKRWTRKREQQPTEPVGHHDATQAAMNLAKVAPQAQEHARRLAATALDFVGSGVRRLGRGQARTYLPFDLG